MKVLYSFPHDLGAPGIGTTAWEQVNALKHAGADVHVVCGHVRRQPPAGVAVKTTLSVAGRRVPHRAFGRDRALEVHDRRAAMVLRRGTFDVVHGWPAASVATFQAARVAGIPSVREVPNTHIRHSYDVIFCESERLGLRQREGHSHTRNDHRLSRALAEYDLADLLLTPSDASRRTFISAGWPTEKLFLHRYGHSLDPGHVPREGPTCFLFAGRGEPRKGLHFALRAWPAVLKLNPDVKLTIVGEFLEDYKQLLKDALRQPGVEVLPFTADLPSLMRRYDVLLLPSIEEGSALVTYEAQACGMALLCSEESGGRFSHGIHGFVHEAGDVDALAEHMTRLATDRVLLRTLQAAAADNARSLTWVSTGGPLLEAYRRARTQAQLRSS